MSADNGDWAWKRAQDDTGLTPTSSCSPPTCPRAKRNGGKPFTPTPGCPDAIAASWPKVGDEENPLRVEVKLQRRDVPEKAGVMAAREFTADDVVFSYDRLNKSPKKIPTYFDHVDRSRPRASTR